MKSDKKSQSLSGRNYNDHLYESMNLDSGIPMNDLKPTTLIEKKKKLIADVLAAEYRSA